MAIAEGIFAICKPKGITSHDVIVRIKRDAGGAKVGHAGTLDPLASGVLVVGIGREATKQLGDIVQKEKEYIADIKLDAFTDSGDAEMPERRVSVDRIPTLEETKLSLSKFRGNIKQGQTTYSAIKVSGKRAYKIARVGKTMNMGFRTVEINDIEVLKYKWPMLKIRVVTGSGVYIRVLARDIGRDLGAGGYITDLVRTRVGEYRLEDCKRNA